MFALETYAAVRRFIFIEGKSRREAARAFGLSRDTIAKMCRPPALVAAFRPRPPSRQRSLSFAPTASQARRRVLKTTRDLYPPRLAWAVGA